MVEAARFVITEEHAGQRLDRVLTELLKEHSRAAVQRCIRDGQVLVNQRPCRGADKAVAGAVVQVGIIEVEPTSVAPDATVPFEVLHEDDALLVVHKPAGVVVHPARGHQQGTLVAGLLSRPGFERAPVDPLDPEGQKRPGVVHRLDKDTSGVLVVAKQATARESLKRQLAEHSVEREYEALTVGVPQAGRIETLHGRDPRSRLKFSCSVLQGRRAVTHLEVLSVYGARQAAWVRCRLETGRTHQIRVHLAEHQRTPILADDLYGPSRLPEPLEEVRRSIGRQALHARVLGFVHPITGENLRFEVPAPRDFALAQELLRALGVSAKPLPARQGRNSL